MAQRREREREKRYSRTGSSPSAFPFFLERLRFPFIAKMIQDGQQRACERERERERERKNAIEILRKVSARLSARCGNNCRRGSEKIGLEREERERVCVKKKEDEDARQGFSTRPNQSAGHAASGESFLANSPISETILQQERARIRRDAMLLSAHAARDGKRRIKKSWSTLVSASRDCERDATR